MGVHDFVVYFQMVRNKKWLSAICVELRHSKHLDIDIWNDNYEQTAVSALRPQWIIDQKCVVCRSCLTGAGQESWRLAGCTASRTGERERSHDGITIRSEITSKNELKMLNWTNLFLIIFILPSSVWFIGQLFYYKRLCILMTPHGAEGGGGVRDWQETFSLSAGGNTRLSLVWVTEGFPRSALHCPPWHRTLCWDELTLNMFVWWLENHYK